MKVIKNSFNYLKKLGITNNWSRKIRSKYFHVEEEIAYKRNASNVMGSPINAMK